MTRTSKGPAAASGSEEAAAAAPAPGARALAAWASLLPTDARTVFFEAAGTSLYMMPLVPSSAKAQR